MFTLFCIMVSNNWDSFVGMYAALEGTTGPNYFFTVYYLLSIFVMLNIVVSVIMEIYAIVLEDSESKFEKLD